MLMRNTVLCGIVVLALGHAPSAAQEVIFVDFEKGFQPATVETHNAKVSVSDAVLRLESEVKDTPAAIVLKPQEKGWDFSAFHEIGVPVRNAGTETVTVQCRAESEDASGAKRCSLARLTLAAGERNVFRVTLTQALPPELRVRLTGMRGIPFGMAADIDSGNITRLVIDVAKPGDRCCLELRSPRVWCLSEPNQPIGEDTMLPMVDKFGQYVHKEWLNKVHAAEDLAKFRKQETEDLAAHPSPAGWDQYGGWADGPQLKATGFFRTEKLNGKWWLVDPEGRVFWSQGITCVGWGEGRTTMKGREGYFVEKPINYKEGDHFDFLLSNFQRKYGEDWKTEYAGLSHQRLRSWGMNTIGTWSDREIFLMKRTPYATIARMGGKPIAGSQGYWGKFVDVFDDDFAKVIERGIVDKVYAEDPWCIGHFVDCELCWGDEYSLAAATLISPADQPAKRVFLDDLRKKYGEIEKLNDVWGTHYASWDAMLQSKTSPDRKKARADLIAFSGRLANRYFEVASAAIKKSSPNHLYLGCRFSRSNEPAVRAAGKFCDVVSFNRYQYTIADLRFPEGVDKPIVIGEYHFGAADRGVFNAGLSPMPTQQDRAKAYKAYVESAIDNPWIVGAHYFMYTDQPITGRFDSENYQLGFVDICDTPYVEMVQAARDLGEELYPRRMGTK